MKKIIKKGGYSEFHVPFEKITANRTSFLEHSKAALFIGIALLLISIAVFIGRFSDKSIDATAAPFWFTVSLISFFIYYRSRARKLFLYTNENTTIAFFSDKPSKETVNEFITELLQKRNEYLMSKYGQLTRNLEYAPQLDNLNWLLNNRILSKAAYDEKVKELNLLFSNHSGNKTIGFVGNN